MHKTTDQLFTAAAVSAPAARAAWALYMNGHTVEAIDELRTLDAPDAFAAEQIEAVIARLIEQP